MTMGDFDRSSSFRKREGSGRSRDRDSRGGSRDGGFRSGGGGFGGRSSGGRSFEKEMHTVKCDKCGETCEVPFKPTNNKPVYCSSCFRKGESSGSDSVRSSPASSGVSKTDIIEINSKLDRILAILEREE
ncbi:MAG: CxxC-x17-CxxC domain-containing protein [Candidatus Woesearchaeota archaeon]